MFSRRKKQYVFENMPTIICFGSQLIIKEHFYDCKKMVNKPVKESRMW